ncbi:MAG TPA: hypothetical protein VKR82_04030 [Candidatus Acidoferrales bacterium]|nr:hypothetical protein [Candidatus Acidoferrales bacterium]
MSTRTLEAKGVCTKSYTEPLAGGRGLTLLRAIENEEPFVIPGTECFVSRRIEGAGATGTGVGSVTGADETDALGGGVENEVVAFGVRADS